MFVSSLFASSTPGKDKKHGAKIVMIPLSPNFWGRNFRGEKKKTLKSFGLSDLCGRNSLICAANRVI
jgi:hypothetical protein